MLAEVYSLAGKRSIMRYVFVVSIFANCFIAIANTQEPQIIWEKFFGGGICDEGRRIFLKPDGGFAIMGLTCSYGNQDSTRMYLAETDALGNLLWERVHTPSGRTRYFYDGCAVTSGGYLLAGYINNDYMPMQSNSDFYIWRADTLGNTQWTMEFGNANYNEFLHSIDETIDGGCVAVGVTNPDTASNPSISLLKIDSLGGVEWERSYHFSDFGDIGWSVVETQDGGYTIAAQSLLGSGEALRVFKVDADGSVMWSCSLSQAYSQVEIKGMEHTSDDGYIIVGSMRNTNDIWLVKLNTNGQVEWQSFVGTDRQDLGQSVYQTSDCGFLVAGFTYVNSYGNLDAYLAKVDSLGSKLWDSQIGTEDDEVYAYGIVETSSGNCVFIGTNDDSSQNGEIWLVAVESQYGIEEEASSQDFVCSVVPNPFSTQCTFDFSLIAGSSNITVTVLDICGRQISTLHSASPLEGSGLLVWNGTDECGTYVPGGLYLFRIETESSVEYRRAIHVR